MNNQISFDINCRSGLISANNTYSVTITIEDCDKDDLIQIITDSCSADEILNHLDESEVLDSIGVDKIKRYYGLTETE